MERLVFHRDATFKSYSSYSVIEDLPEKGKSHPFILITSPHKQPKDEAQQALYQATSFKYCCLNGI